MDKTGIASTLRGSGYFSNCRIYAKDVQGCPTGIFQHLHSYPSGLLDSHWGNHTSANEVTSENRRLWVNVSHKFTRTHKYNHNKAKHNKTMCIFDGIIIVTLHEGHDISNDRQLSCLFDNLTGVTTNKSSWLLVDSPHKGLVMQKPFPSILCILWMAPSRQLMIM